MRAAEPSLRNASTKRRRPWAQHPDLGDAPRRVQCVVARVGIGLELPTEVGEERLGAVALVRARGVEDYLSAERIEIGPQPALVAPRRVVEDGDRRVVGLQVVGRQHLASQLLANGCERGRDIGYPAAERRAWQVDPFARADALEPVERQMVLILRHNHVGQEALRRERFLEGLRRGRGLDHAVVAPRTGHTWPAPSRSP